MADSVWEVIKQFDDWEDRLQRKWKESKDFKHKYCRDLDTKISACLDVTSKGVSRWPVPYGWKRHRSALQPRNNNDGPLRRLELGTLIDIAYHTKVSRETTDLFDSRETPTICGPVYTKIRTVIVVALPLHYAVCLPIFSHHGEGLINKNENERKEFIAVRPEDGTWWKPENDLGVLMAKEDAYNWTKFLSEKSYVKFTELACHDYSAPCRIVGKLEEESMDRLLGLLHSIFPASERSQK